MKRIALLVMLALLSQTAWAAAEKPLPKAEAEQLLKAADKAVCTNPKIECGVFKEIVAYKGYALVMAAVQYAPEMYVLLKKEGKLWKAVHAQPVGLMEDNFRELKLPQEIVTRLTDEFNRKMYQG